MTSTIEFELFTSSFCGACAATRAVLHRAIDLVPGGVVVEHSIEPDSGAAERRRIASTPTPTTIVTADGMEVFRAAGVPTVDQVLRAAARALTHPPGPA